MREQFDRMVSTALTVAALAIAATLMHREVSRGPTGAIRGSTKSPERVAIWPELIAAGHLLGKAQAPVTIVEFGDFECPFCRKYESKPKRSKWTAVFQNQVAVVFIQYPLATANTQIRRACAARAAECAAADGRFEAFHNVLFDKQDSPGLKARGSSFAVDAGVRDTAAFGRCVSTTAPLLSVGTRASHWQRGWAYRVPPTILINGWRLLRFPPNDSARSGQGRFLHC